MRVTMIIDTGTVDEVGFTVDSYSQLTTLAR
jgi:hypothetical protein